MTKARLALFFGIIIISTYPSLVKLNEAPDLVAAFYRMSLPLIFLLPFVFATKKLILSDRKNLLLAALSGLFIASDIAIWNVSIKESTAAQATFLVNLAPIWVGLISLVVLKIKPHGNFWLGALVALMGMLIMLGWRVFYYMQFDRAFLFALLAGVFYAAYIITSKKVLAQLNLWTFFTISLLSSSVYLALLNLIAGNSFVGFTQHSWIIILIQGFVVQLIAWLLINYALKHMKATRVSLSLLSQAILSAVFARFLVGEELSLPMILGGTIILIGIALTFIEKAKAL
jgi:drug/metabolite transporter (DMT)-like permease